MVECYVGGARVNIPAGSDLERFIATYESFGIVLVPETFRGYVVVVLGDDAKDKDGERSGQLTGESTVSFTLDGRFISQRSGE